MSESALTERRTEPSATPAPEDRPQRLFVGLRIVSLCTLASRILGLVRDIGMASLFGNGPVMDAFSVAFRVPNLFRRLFGEGALTAAFLPLFVRETNRHGREAGWRLSSAVFAALSVSLVGLVLAGEAVLWVLWTTSAHTMESRLLLGLTAVMLPYVVMICLAAQQSAVLNALDRFALPALLPVVMNVIWISGIFILAPRASSAETQSYIVAGCVLAAGLVQCVAQWPALARLGYRFSWDRSTAWEQVKEVSAAMMPVVLGLTVAQANTLADSLMAWGLAPSDGGPATMPLPGNPAWPVAAGTASALYFGQRLYQFPLGIFGVALGTVLFPLLSRHAENGRLDLLRRDLGLGLRLVLAIGIPASVGLMILAEPVTALFFRHGAFDEADLAQTSRVVAIYAMAVWAWCGLLIVTRGAYAAGDRRTPLQLSVWAVVVNLVLNLALVWPLGGAGLALGTSATAILQMIAASLLLQKQVGTMDWRRIGSTLAKTIIGAAVMTAIAIPMDRVLPHSNEMASRLLRVAVPLAGGIAGYAAVARILRLDEFWMLFGRSVPDSRQNRE